MQQSSLSAEEKFNHYDACTLNEKTIRTNEKRKKKYRGKRENKWKEKSNDYFSIRVDKRCNVLDSPYLLTHSVSEVCRYEDASGSRTLR